MGSVGFCGVVYTAQRERTTQIPIGFCVLVLGLSLGFGLRHCNGVIKLTVAKTET